MTKNKKHKVIYTIDCEFTTTNEFQIECLDELLESLIKTFMLQYKTSKLKLIKKVKFGKF